MNLEYLGSRIIYLLILWCEKWNFFCKATQRKVHLLQTLDTFFFFAPGINGILKQTVQIFTTTFLFTYFRAGSVN